MGNIAVYFLLVSAQQGLPSNLLSSLCYVESRHELKAIHRHDGKGDSIGVCQIKLATAHTLGFKGTEKQLFSPEINVLYAGKYLAHQIKRYNGNLAKGVIAYNQGSAHKAINTLYQKKVFKVWEQSRRGQNICGI